MSKVLIGVMIIIFITGSYLILYSVIRASAIAEQRMEEIRSRETSDKEQLITNRSSISGGAAMENKMGISVSACKGDWSKLYCYRVLCKN